MTTTTTKTPRVLEAERAVLGAILLDDSCLPVVTERLSPEDFDAPCHRLALAHLMEMRAAGEVIDSTTLASRLMARAVPGADWPVYLSDLYRDTVSSANVGAYVELVAKAAAVRRLHQRAGEVMRAMVAGADAEEAAGELSRAIEAVQAKQPRRFVDLRDAARLALKELEQREQPGAKPSIWFVPTGLTDLDRMIVGWGEGLLHIVAARPRMGKTAFMSDRATHGAMMGQRHLVFSTEMSWRELARRSVAARARVPLRMLRAGSANADEWVRMERAVDAFPEQRVLIDDQPDLTVAQMQARAEREHARAPLSCIWLDYLQRIAPPGNRSINREQQVGQLTADLKTMARRLRVPVIALAQLGRAGDESPDERSEAEQLRESDRIFAEADVVIVLKRPVVYDKAADPRLAKLEILKQRDGEEGDVTVDFYGEHQRFEDRGTVIAPAAEAKHWTDD